MDHISDVSVHLISTTENVLEKEMFGEIMSCRRAFTISLDMVMLKSFIISRPPASICGGLDFPI